MAGVTNSAFRTIAKELGADHRCNGNGLSRESQYNNEKPCTCFISIKGENPVFIQLLVVMKTALARAAEFIQENTVMDTNRLPS